MCVAGEREQGGNENAEKSNATVSGESEEMGGKHAW
jgi:hypothetical protein